MLMLEYCPRDMTPEQISTWAQNQITDEAMATFKSTIEFLRNGR